MQLHKLICFVTDGQVDDPFEYAKTRLTEMGYHIAVDCKWHWIWDGVCHKPLTQDSVGKLKKIFDWEAVRVYREASKQWTTLLKLYQWLVSVPEYSNYARENNWLVLVSEEIETPEKVETPK